MWVTKLETIQYSVGKAALGDLKDGYKKKRKVKKSKKSLIGAAEDAAVAKDPVLKKGRMLQMFLKGRLLKKGRVLTKEKMLKMLKETATMVRIWRMNLLCTHSQAGFKCSLCHVDFGLGNEEQLEETIKCVSKRLSVIECIMLRVSFLQSWLTE